MKTTLGVIEYERLQAWIEAAGFRREAAFVEFALRVRTEVQRQYLRSVFDNLQAFGHVLRRWESGGTNCYGMAELALAWARHAPPTRGASGVPGRELGRQPLDVDFKDARREGKIDERRDALYLLMQCMVPQGPDSEAHLTLRAWTFLHGLRLALKGQTTDYFLADACRGLRLAAYELEGGAWRRSLEPLGLWTRTHDALSEQIRGIRTSEDFKKTGSAASTIARVCRYAEGERRAIADAAEDDSTALPSLPPDFTAHLQLEARLETESVEVARELRPAHPSAGEDVESDALELSALDVDPEASPAAQSLYVRSARLQLGAAARFLPWDWHQILPPERQALERLVGAALQEPPSLNARLLASFTWFALNAGLSLEEALQVPVQSSQSSPHDSEWVINLPQARADRRPPRRAEQRRPNDEQMDHLCPIAEALHLPLPATVWTTWREEASARPLVQRLGQLWRDTEVTASAAFRQWVQRTAATRRLQPSMLKHVLGQQAYEETGDHVLARLLPSTPDSALPAATVYAAYDTHELSRLWTGLVTTPEPKIARLNAAGSFLDPNGDEQFADAFGRERQTIEALATESEDWISFHNAVALYWDAALRAATGVRPVNDLWVSESDFDWEEGFVYVDDKASPVAHTGRLIPLPTQLWRDLQQHYLGLHLPWILQQLRHAGASVPQAPFLFIVRASVPPTVTPVENKHRRGVEVGTPLPLNVFRHRLRSYLHRDETVDKEVIDSLMGHGDGATLTHGDHSMRTWKTDAVALRGALNTVFARLSVSPPALRGKTAPEAAQGPTDAAETLTPLRRRNRSPGLLKHYRDAVRVINKYLRDLQLAANQEASSTTPDPELPRPLDRLLRRLATLSSAQVDSLSKQLMRSETQLADPAGVVRYEFLLRLAQEASSRHGLRLAIRRRYVAREIEDSPLKPEAVGAIATIRRLRTCLDTQFDGIRSASRVSLSLALLLLKLDLCVVSRIAHRALLASLLDTPDRWRVVTLQSEFHLEWSPQENLRTNRDAPCMRVQISARAAWLLTEIVAPKTRRRHAWGDSTPATSLCAAVIQPLSADHPPNAQWTNAAVLDQVITLVDQANLIELPGTVAGYLAGRVMTSSLGWGEWLRLRQGRWVDTASIAMPLDLDADSADSSADATEIKAPRYARIDDEDEGDAVDPSPSTHFKRVAPSDIGPHARARQAHKLVQAVQRSIRELKETKGLSKRRQKRAASLASLIKDQSGAVSSTIRLLCLWAVDMLLRPGRSRKLATSSVERYFVALSPRFKSIGADVEIDAMDDEEIESFYREVLDVSPMRALSDVHAGLRSFHAFAHRVAGLPAIDWSAVAVEQDIALGAPGFLDEATYLRLVEQLESDGSCRQTFGWQLQCFVILCYRYGLRAGECAGLTRADLIWPRDLPYVLVRRNRLRALKTNAARRAVPLLFRLAGVEAAAVRQLRDTMLPVHGKSDEELPLFALPDRPEAAIDDLAVRRHLNAVLQRLTGQRGTTLHDLRHSFATHVWAATQPSGWQVLEQAAPDQDSLHANGVLLGKQARAATRRAPWAVARLMGHAHPRTAMQSYVHSLSDVHRRLVDIASVRCPDVARPDITRCVKLDAAADSVAGYIPEPSTTALDAAACLVALRYLAAGRSDAKVHDYTRLHPEVVRYLREASGSLVDALTASKRSGLRKHLQSDADSARLSPAGLPALVHAAAFSRMRDGLRKIGGIKGAPVPGAVASVDTEDWAAMVGSRREISLWKRGQFELFHFAIRTLTPPTRSIVLQVPKRKHAETSNPNTGALADLARDTGWLPSTERRPATGLEPLCESLTEVKSAPAVRLHSSGSRVERRAILAFNAPPDGHVLDRIELIVCALCVCAFARQRFHDSGSMRFTVA